MDLSSIIMGILSIITTILCVIWQQKYKQKDTNLIKKFEDKIEYNQAIIASLKKESKIIRIIVNGPHFLHLLWLIERRLDLEPGRESFSLALQNFLKDSIEKPKRDIKIFIRNSTRYLYYLIDPPPLIKLNEVSEKLEPDMIKNLEQLFPCERNVKFCCTDPGNYYYNIAIIDEYFYRHMRDNDISPILNGYRVLSTKMRKEELKYFDKEFKISIKVSKYRNPFSKIISLVLIKN